MTDEVMIDIRGVSKTFKVEDAKLLSLISKKRKNRSVKVLDNIDLTIYKGEIVGIIGRNGSGKTTLMKIMAGMIKHDKGTIRKYGKVVGIIESGTMFMYDDTGYDNIAHCGRLYGMTREEITMKLPQIVADSELGEDLMRPVKTYSLGMRARLGFSIVSHLDADLYILDEALNAGDSIFSGKARTFLNNLALKGKTVVISSHSMGMIKDICTRVVLLEDHKIVSDGSPDIVCARYRMSPYVTPDIESGNPDVLFRAAKTTCKNSENNEKMIENAAIGKNKKAMVEYGDILLGKGDVENALKYYELAAKAGDRDGKLRFATVSIGFDNNELVEHFAITSWEDAFGEYREGCVLYRTSSGLKMRKNTYDLLLNAYKKGNVDAGFLVCEMKLHGDGTDMDIDGAIEILADNADRGHRESAKRLYSIYTKGTYVEPDEKKAFVWCSKAAKMGDANSQFELAEMYRNGAGTEKNEGESKRWFLAFVTNAINDEITDSIGIADKINTNKIRSVNEMLEKTLQGYNEKNIREYTEYMIANGKVSKENKFAKCSELCNTGKNMGLLGRCYLEGIGVEPDEKEAFRLYSIAANAGDKESMFILSKLYRLGIGTEKDHESANLWMNTAAKNGQRGAMLLKEQKDGILKKRIVSQSRKDSHKKKSEEGNSS